jgi:hypothetical protein
VLRFAVLAAFGMGLIGAPLAARAQDEDPDLPASMVGHIDKDAYLQARSDFIALLRGFADDPTGQKRVAAVTDLQNKMDMVAPFTNNLAWTPIGPYPIPNGQTTNVSSTVSGRVTAIAIHPTNPDIVYVGTAQGGVYRSLDGGLTWTALFDAAASLAVGALALAPSNPSILYVGTGEPNFSGDCYFGVGLYRIDNADTAPVLNGPFNPTPTTDIIGAKTFTGRSISKIVVEPGDPATIFVGTVQGIGGLYGEALGSSPPITSLRGVYRSQDATSASPSFSKLTVSSASSIAPDVSGNQQVTDLVLDPTDATGNTMLVWLLPAAAATGGVFRSTNVLNPVPTAVTFAQQFSPGVVSIRGTFALTTAGGPLTAYVATGETATGTGCTTGSGAIRKSTDGGLTWSGKLAGGGGFCGGQCVYDQPIAVSQADANRVLIGGAGNSSCSRVYCYSLDGAATFSAAGVGDAGMHADAHAIAFAPSDPTVVYEGNDGGIWRSNDGGQTFASRNTAGFSATQFQSIDVHPIDPNFSIGGTQDNGTNMYQPAATWNRVDFGDGGFAVIDQNAPDNVNVTMYHTYFNQRNNLVAYAHVSSVVAAFDGNWSISGQNANGISTTENPNFYAPLVRGPGSPNTIYYATDRLHRSADGGLTNPVVSQAPIATSGGLGVPISAVSIAPGNDNVRLVALNNATIWGTVTGSSVLTNMTQAGMPAHFIARLAIDPTNSNVAYACFGGFGLPAGQHVWKTTNLLTGTPTWSASGAGLPDAPANAFAIDPANPNQVWVGTDVGVFISGDGGATWLPYNTGLPVVAVFDMAIQPVVRVLRIATHGRGMWERSIDVPVPALASVTGSEYVQGKVHISWYLPSRVGAAVDVMRRPVPGDWAKLSDGFVDQNGGLSISDGDVAPGRSFEYALALTENGSQLMAGQVWVDIPKGNTFALTHVGPNPSATGFRVSFSLPSAAPATLELVSVTGRLIETRNVGRAASGPQEIDLGKAQKLSPGAYWVRLTQAGRTFSQRVIAVR